MGDPKLHHYVPQFYLRRFTDSSGLTYVWDKKTPKIFRAAPSGIAAQTHFYRIPEFIGTEVDPLFLEKNLAELEGQAAGILDEVLSSLPGMKSLERLMIEDEARWVLSSFLAVQFLRSAEQREILALFATTHGTYEELPPPDECINLHAEMLCSGGLVEDLTKHLMEAIWLYARNDTSIPFWTSDNPVAFKTGDNRMWLKGPGIFSRYPFTGTGSL